MSASLMPRNDSFNARVRGSSHIDFKTATTGVAAKSMRNEISRLVSTVEDPATKRAFDTEMQSFFYLFTRYLSERAQSQDLYVLIILIAPSCLLTPPTATGSASSPPQRTRSSPMLTCLNPKIRRTSISSPSSRSTVV